VRLQISSELHVFRRRLSYSIDTVETDPCPTPSVSVISGTCADQLMHHSLINYSFNAWGRMQCTICMPEIGWLKTAFCHETYRVKWHSALWMC